MAAWGVVQGERRDIQITGANTAVQVERVTGETTPNGVFFDVLVPLAEWEANGSDTVIAPIAEGIETYYQTWNAVAAIYREQLDANGLVTFFMDFWIEVPPARPSQIGPFQGVVSIPLLSLGEGDLLRGMINGEFQKVHDAITATMNL